MPELAGRLSPRDPGAQNQQPAALTGLTTLPRVPGPHPWLTLPHLDGPDLSVLVNYLAVNVQHMYAGVLIDMGRRLMMS